MSRTILSFAVLVAVAVASRAQEAGATHADWPHYGGTQFSWRYSALDQVNTSNVKNLLPAWIFQTGDYADNLQATPIVVDGVMYLISAQLQVFALDAATGRVIWQYNSVVALDADTGKLRWHHQEVPDDVWDYDSSYEVILMDREFHGRMRKVLVHLNKGGLTTVLDRASGEFLGI